MSGLRLLYLQKIFRERTDKEHPYTVSELIAALSCYGITVERKALYRDIAALRESGTEVIMRRSKEVAYYTEPMPFDLSELQLVADAVQSSQFISRRKAAETVKKLSQLANLHTAGLVSRSIYMPNRRNSTQDALRSKLEAFFNALAAGRRIAFTYEDMPESKRYELSVCTVIYDKSGFFLAACGTKLESGVGIFALDRISGAEITKMPAENVKTVVGDMDFDIQLYIDGFFGTLSGEDEEITAVVSEDFLPLISEKMQSVNVVAKRGTSYTVTFSAVFDTATASWFIANSEKLRVTAPDGVKNALRTISEKAYRQYR